MIEDPVFHINQITDEFGITGIEFTPNYDDVYIYAVDNATNTVDEVIDSSIKYDQRKYVVWDENENEKNTSVDYTLNIELKPKKGYLFKEIVNKEDMRLCNGVERGKIEIMEYNSQMIKMNITFTMTAEELRNIATE